MSEPAATEQAPEAPSEAPPELTEAEAKAAKKAAAAAKKAARPVVTEIPKIRDEFNLLNILKKHDFPVTDLGGIAFLEYMIEKCNDQISVLKGEVSPAMIARKQMKKLSKEMDKLAVLAGIVEEGEGDEGDGLDEVEEV